VAIPVCLERGTKKCFASALEWPGWSRSGKTEEEAIEALAEYAARYSAVPELAGLKFPARAGGELEVVERVKGDGATDFGVPHVPAEREFGAVDAKTAKRMAALVTASWGYLDRVAASAPATLRKGPRGGGRDRDPIVGHVREAEVAYAAKLGIRAKDHPEALRPRIIEVLGSPAPAKERHEKGWPVRYAARRIAWHALDHAWEIEDKS
jgi:hypothetical protein